MTTNTILVLGLAVALAFGLVLFTKSGSTAGPQARELVAAGASLLDVRTPAEFADAHLPGALNIPVQDLQRRMRELEAKERPIVVYCRSGNRSAQASQLLKGAGYTAVHDLGAMSNW
jgi:rhodanese-related sulfurtransferase